MQAGHASTGLAALRPTRHHYILPGSLTKLSIHALGSPPRRRTIMNELFYADGRVESVQIECLFVSTGPIGLSAAGLSRGGGVTGRRAAAGGRRVVTGVREWL